jgi:uncharacterized membrane protein YqjE
MPESVHYSANGRSVAEVVTEVRDEVKDFVQTRVQLLVTEVRHKVENSGKAAAYASIAIVLLGTGFLLFTLALVGLVAVAFWGSPYAWFFSFLIVGIAWLAGGAMMAFAARKSFRGITPSRTLEVLRRDRIWLQSEVKPSHE